VNDDGAITGVRPCKTVNTSLSRTRAVIITCGGYEYNIRMRKAFLDGPGKKAGRSTSPTTGDGIRMALKSARHSPKSAASPGA
jgi:succinate dehydrogenase/fumarate reductase flavoprotein subunit